MPDYPKKLIEVALPLDDINAEGAREKSLRHGHPSTLHLWWARRPLAVARAVLFAQLVNDPGGKRGWGTKRGQTKEDAQHERERLFEILRELVEWKNINNETVLEKARMEIRKSWEETCRITGDDPSKLPVFHDPFAGGGAIPLEAQRLGLEAHASDINPVAVLINKAMIEIPPKFADNPPIHPGQDKVIIKPNWHGAEGLAEDVHYYGQWMRDEAFKRIGHLYHKVKLPKEYGGGSTTVSAWLWARTVESPNPAYKGCFVPLISNFFLCAKKGKLAWIRPIVEGRSYRFEVRMGSPKNAEQIRMGTKVARGASFRCLLSNVPISSNYIKSEGKAGRIGSTLIAVVAEGSNSRVYISPEPWMMEIASEAKPEWVINQKLNYEPRKISTPIYGLETYEDLFTTRQMTALSTFSDLIECAGKRILEDAKKTGMKDDGKGLADGGVGATAYSQAVSTYLAFVVDKVTDYWSSLSSWDTSREAIRNIFGRQAIPMVWDYAETNPFSNSSGNWMSMVSWVRKSFSSLPAQGSGKIYQADAAKLTVDETVVISTDPPYYDNISYADLSDFFYVWLRRALRGIYPDLLATMLVPKNEEIIASPYRHGGREDAELFFLEGMKRAIARMAVNTHPALPITIYYAFKQAETKKSGTASTGWEVFLDAVMSAGFAITGTWPMRTELANKIGQGTNLLASSIVLVCRKRDENAKSIPRRQFLRELDNGLPDALDSMIGEEEGASPIAPVDLAQAAIGPGMAIFSQYTAVLEADGSPMSVHTALTLINKMIDEYFTHVESDMDADTRFCIDWFQQYGFRTGFFGEADVLARAKGTSVEGVRDAGVLESGSGKVRLLRPEEYDMTWNPREDDRVPAWEACHQICRVLNAGESDAGALLAEMPEKTEQIRQLAYRLYTVCERKGWAKEASVYNGLVTSWREVIEARREVMSDTQGQRELL